MAWLCQDGCWRKGAHEAFTRTVSVFNKTTIAEGHGDLGIHSLGQPGLVGRRIVRGQPSPGWVEGLGQR